MIVRFPIRRDVSAPAVEPGLHLHDPAAPTAAVQDGEQEWVHWLFHSVRARCGDLLLRSRASTRAELLADWTHYTQQVWQPTLAPALLQAWQAAALGEESSLLEVGAALQKALPATYLGRSVQAGECLLRATRGARYQGSLGRLRQHVDQGQVQAHLYLVWGAVAALFQMPAVSVLAAVLREEWAASSQHCPQAAPPQGPLSFDALIYRAMKAATWLRFSGDAVG